MDTRLAGPEWAHGCEHCRHGIRNYTAPTGRDTLYMERLVMAVDGLLDFCDCKAGHMLRQYLRRQYRVVEQLTAGVGGIDQPVGGVMLHNARAKLHETTDYVPTVRYTGTVDQSTLTGVTNAHAG